MLFPPSTEVQVSLKLQTGHSEWVTSVDLSSHCVTLGRDEACSIRIQDEHASRQHATLWLQDGLLQVFDSSRNGTWVGELFLHNQGVAVSLETPIRIGETLISLAPVVAVASTDAAVRATAEPEVPAELEVPDATPKAAAKGEVPPELRREAHRLLLEHLHLGVGDLLAMEDASLRPRVLQSLRRIVANLVQKLPDAVDTDKLVGALADEALGLGPLEDLLADPSVSEIMVVDPGTVFVERGGHCERVPQHFTDDDRVRAVVERIVTPLGRRIDESSPLVDARLKDGSRVNAVIRPLAIRGTCITIRKFPKSQLSLERMVELGSIDERMIRFLRRSVRARKNIIVAGGTGSGKTTLLNALSTAIPEHERVVTVEDSAELQLNQPHVVSLETRPPNMEGKGAYTIRDLVKNALRMRPDRIVVGECRGGEALDMLQAMNTGHDGSLTTVHANSPKEAASRLETLCLMAGLDLPVKAIREQIAGSVDLFVQQTRLQDGSRRVSAVAEVCGIDSKGLLVLRPIYEFVQHGVDADGRVRGEFLATGYLPSYLGELIVRGLIPEGEPYL